MEAPKESEARQAGLRWGSLNNNFGRLWGVGAVACCLVPGPGQSGWVDSSLEREIREWLRVWT